MKIKNGLKNIQTAGYNGARTVLINAKKERQQKVRELGIQCLVLECAEEDIKTP